MLRRRPVTAGLLALPLVLTGCEDAQRLLEKLSQKNAEDQAYVAIPGAPAQGFLEPVPGGAAVNSAAALEAIDVAASEKAAANLREMGLVDTDDEGKPAKVSEGAAAVLTETQAAKEAFTSTKFKKDSEAFFQKKKPAAFSVVPQETVQDTVAWSATGDRFTISTLDKMPVRDQGDRGTCAAFAGIGQLEGLILKKFPATTAIDLSEQRFYYAAKPDHWATGGDPGSEGSDSGSGFASSARFAWTDFNPAHKYQGDFPAGLNIPLEVDCPYGPKPGANDLQLPHPSGCTKGAVKVKGYASWNENEGAQLKTAQQIYDFLLQKDYPVIVGTRLSQNWDDTDGMITVKDGGTPANSPHAGGHAYLIVGARKLSEAEFPGEGGMCFVIKNSWGKGWGVNGLACMTLAWFNAWRFPDDAYPLVTDVEMDAATVKAGEDGAKTVPANIVEPDPGTKGSGDAEPFGGLKKKRGEAHVDFAATDATDGAGGILLTIADFTVGKLIGPDDQAYKVLYRVDGDSVAVRGVLKGQEKQTNDFTATLKDGKFLMREVPGREPMAFGELDTTAGQMTLCSRAYTNVCHLNYVAEWNELVSGLTEQAARTEEPREPFEWKGVSLKGYGIEVSVPDELGSKLDVRFQLDGAYTNPQRFAVDLLGGAISWRGKQIGDYQKFQVCNGSFADVCRVVVAGDKFHVLFKAKKK